MCQFGELGTVLPRIGSVGGPAASFKKSPGGVKTNTVIDLSDSQNGPIPTTVGNMSIERPPDATVAEDGMSTAAPAVTPVAGTRPLTPSAVTLVSKVGYNARSGEVSNHLPGVDDRDRCADLLSAAEALSTLGAVGDTHHDFSVGFRNPEQKTAMPYSAVGVDIGDAAFATVENSSPCNFAELLDC